MRAGKAGEFGIRDNESPLPVSLKGTAKSTAFDETKARNETGN
jgi:hypothetical protein